MDPDQDSDPEHRCQGPILACCLPGEVARVGEDRVGEDSVGAAADLGTRLLGDVASAPTKPSLLPAGNTSTPYSLPSKSKMVSHVEISSKVVEDEVYLIRTR